MLPAVNYNSRLTEIRETPEFKDWIRNLKDRRAIGRINIRLRRISLGNLGDIKPVGEGISELRILYGPGYRVYLTQRGDVLVILLCGGDKSRQKQDIKRAKELAKELDE